MKEIKDRRYAVVFVKIKSLLYYFLSENNVLDVNNRSIRQKSGERTLLTFFVIRDSSKSNL